MSAGSAAATSGQPHSMTELFMSDFFPTVHKGLRNKWPAVWQLVQPDWLAEQCPEQTLSLQLPGLQLQLRNPSLLPVQLAGVAVALWGLRRLAVPGHAYLRASLTFFLCMNLSSIACHAMAQHGTLMWRTALLADVVCTGASSLSLLLGQVAGAPRTAAGARSAARRCWAVFLALLAAAACNEWAQVPWVPEAMYLGTTVAAAAATALRLLMQWLHASAQARVQQLPRLAAAALAVALMQLCLPLDPLLCAAAGPWLGTVPVLFLGSDLGFAVLIWIAGEKEEEGAAAATGPAGRIGTAATGHALKMD